MMLTVLGWFSTPLRRGGAILAALLAFLGAFAWDQREVGEVKALAKVEKANAKAQAIGRRAADNAGKPVPGSVRDPGYRSED